MVNEAKRCLCLLSHPSMPLFPLGLFLLHSHSSAHMTESSPRVPSWLATCPSLYFELSLPTVPTLYPICFSSSCFFVCPTRPFLSITWLVRGSWKSENVEQSSSSSSHQLRVTNSTHHCRWSSRSYCFRYFPCVLRWLSKHPARYIQSIYF